MMRHSQSIFIMKLNALPPNRGHTEVGQDWFGCAQIIENIHESIDYKKLKTPIPFIFFKRTFAGIYSLPYLMAPRRRSDCSSMLSRSLICGLSFFSSARRAAAGPCNTTYCYIGIPFFPRRSIFHVSH